MLRTFEVFGPTEAANCTVTFTRRTFCPSSFLCHSPMVKSVDLRASWKSVRNFDLENKKLNSVSTRMGRIVCTIWRPSCVDVHSVLGTKLEKA